MLALMDSLGVQLQSLVYSWLKIMTIWLHRPKNPIPSCQRDSSLEEWMEKSKYGNAIRAPTSMSQYASVKIRQLMRTGLEM